MGHPSQEPFSWSEQYEIDIPSVDRQHKHLVEIINRVQQAVLARRGKVVLGKALEELIGYTQAHFAAEEKVLDSCGFPDFLAHHGEHERLAFALMVFHQKITSSELPPSIDVIAFLKDWLGQHILNVDKKYVPFLKGKGVM
jgi:hemerythrin-like metal-binding protein